MSPWPGLVTLAALLTYFIILFNILFDGGQARMSYQVMAPQITGDPHIAGRVLYAWGCYQEVKQQMPGLAVETLANLALVLDG
ncbi:MAG: hypothetical protein HC835_12405 [Oscillatoriales cyanobacterium RM2_1_1]|nr:hypothetical protein [Oscillatoriales cyanobacterium SM2_3_0]NJO46358.1 hypothetical protein [Oscillatoriales cyanobacterium RM2_1_1]